MEHPLFKDKAKRPCYQFHCSKNGCLPNPAGQLTCGRCHDIPAANSAERAVVMSAHSRVRAALPEHLKPKFSTQIK